MNLKHALGYLWKLPLCGVAFFIGMALSGVLLPILGLEPPVSLLGADPNATLLWFFAGSIILALALSFVSQRLQGGFVLRWLALGFLSWMVGAVDTALDAYAFTTPGAAPSGGSLLFTVLSFLLPGLASAAMVALLFRPEEKGEALGVNWPAFLHAHRGRDWAWRVPALIVAFPVIYIIFGVLLQPLMSVFDALGQSMALRYYLAGVAPSWQQAIPAQFGRSLLLLLACLPVLILWQGSRRSLVLSLGLALFVLLGFTSVIIPGWSPWQVRVFHGLETLADSLVYAWVLAVLLGKWETAVAVPAPA